MANKISISFLSYQDPSIPWEFIIKYTDENNFQGEITLTQDKKLTEEEFKILAEIAPSCVWTDYICKQELE